MYITIAELARSVDKSETYIRQHIHRGHLAVRREGRNVSVCHLTRQCVGLASAGFPSIYRLAPR